MGSYAELRIGGYTVYSLKSQVDSITMSLFTELNRHSYIGQDEIDRHKSELEACDSEDEVDPPLTTYEYRSTVGQVIQRLEVMGFTLDESRQYFNEFFEDLGPDLEDEFYLKPYGAIDPTDLTLENWMKAIKYCIEKGVPYYQLGDRDTCDRLDAAGMTWFHVMYFHGDENILGFPGGDIRLALRSCLEIFNNDDQIVLDYSDLVYGGYYNEEDELCEIVSEDLSHTFRPSEQVLVLTEGSSDATIIRDTIKVLYPHLADLFSFLDFTREDFRTEGGVGFIVKVLKVLVSAKVGTKVLAIFDNDLAARDALRSLKVKALPSNIKVITLPELEIAKRYPTIGPGGQTDADINGRALSLELFFGQEILLRPDGSLTPVRWTSFVNSMKEYQGEIDDKERLQKKYRALLKRIQADPAVAEQVDLGDMHKLLQRIFYAFCDHVAARDS
jgi:hypothetical protein